METHFVEALEPAGVNWGKFMLARFTAEEWGRRSAVSDAPHPLLAQVGWRPGNLLVLDLQTGEGFLTWPQGLATADLNTKHQVWVCPMFEPFLTWLYAQDCTDISALPTKVMLPVGTSTALAGYRRKRKP